MLRLAHIISGKSSVGEVNLERVRELAGQIRQAVRQLEQLAVGGEEAFVSDYKGLNAAKYLLVIAIEAVLDICGHIVAKTGGRSPQDYADCIEVLKELGAVDPDFTKRLIRMVRFRNRLVHLYDRINDAEVYRILKENVTDFEQYLESLGRYLKRAV